MVKKLIQSVQYQFGKWFWNSLLTISLFNALSSWIILHRFDILWCGFGPVFFTLKIENICRKSFCIFPAGIYGLIIFYGSSLSLESPTLRVVFHVIWSLPSLLNSKANFIKIDETNHWYHVHQASILNEGSPIFWIWEDFFWSIKQNFYEAQSSKTKISINSTGNIIPFVASTMAKLWMTAYEPFIRWRRNFVISRGVSYHFFPVLG